MHTHTQADIIVAKTIDKPFLYLLHVDDKILPFARDFPSAACILTMSWRGWPIEDFGGPFQSHPIPTQETVVPVEPGCWEFEKLITTIANNYL